MNSPTNEEEEDQGEIFLDESDIIHEIAVDDEGIRYIYTHTLTRTYIRVVPDIPVFVYTHEYSYQSV